MTIIDIFIFPITQLDLNIIKVLQVGCWIALHPALNLMRLLRPHSPGSWRCSLLQNSVAVLHPFSNFLFCTYLFFDILYIFSFSDPHSQLALSNNQSLLYGYILRLNCNSGDYKTRLACLSLDMLVALFFSNKLLCFLQGSMSNFHHLWEKDNNSVIMTARKSQFANKPQPAFPPKKEIIPELILAWIMIYFTFNSMCN